MHTQQQNTQTFKAVITPPVQGDRLLRRTEVEYKTGLSRSAIYEQMRKGTFPEPVRLSTNSVAWLCSEIDEFINQKIAARNQKRA
jgi:prophage regulatory protein